MIYKRKEHGGKGPNFAVACNHTFNQISPHFLLTRGTSQTDIGHSELQVSLFGLFNTALALHGAKFIGLTLVIAS